MLEDEDLDTQHHDWLRVSFVFGEWIECLCGYKPDSQKDMDHHMPKNSRGETSPQTI